MTLPTLVGHAGEGMWLPDQLPKIGESARRRGARHPARNLCRSHRPSDGCDRLARRMLCVVCLAPGTGGDQPPLRLRDHPVQLDRGSKPARPTVFWPQAPADELAAAPGSRVYVTLAVAGCDATTSCPPSPPEPTAPPAYAAIEDAEKKAHRRVRGDARPPLQRSPRSTAVPRIASTTNSRSATCGSPTLRPPPSASTAAISTTGCGPATPATSRFTARMSAPTVSPQTPRRTTSRISRSTGCGSAPKASTRETS